MKKIYLLCLCASAFLQAKAQSPAIDLLKVEGKGTIYISPTDSVVGELQYSELSSDKIYLVEGKKLKKYSAKEIIGFRMESPAKHYIAVDKTTFYRVTNSLTARMYLLRYFVSENTIAGAVIAGGKVAGEWHTGLYLVATSQYLPSSFKKISQALKDCPTLATKIDNKEKGYYFGLVSLPGVDDEVYTRIATEYNSCQ